MKNLAFILLVVSQLSCAKEELKPPYSVKDSEKIYNDPFKYGMKANIITYTDLDTFGNLKRITIRAIKSNLQVSSFTVNDTKIPRVAIDTNALLFQMFPDNPLFRSWGNSLIINFNGQTNIVQPLRLSFDNLPSRLKLKDKVILPTREGEIVHNIIIAEYDPWSNLVGKILYRKKLEGNTLLFDDKLVKTLKIGQRLVFLHQSTESQIIDDVVYSNSCFAISRSFIYTD